MMLDIIHAMKERVRRRRGKKETPKIAGLDRRDFLKIGAVAGLGIAGGLYLREVLYTGEGNEEYRLAGEPLNSGEIIDEKNLIERYIEVIENSSQIEPDQTMVRSTLYHAMRFFGSDEKKALKRSNNVSISESLRETYCGGSACVYDTAKGLGVELEVESLFPENSHPVAWINLLLALSHEAYHLSVKRVDDREDRENYGALGTYEILYDKRGFVRDEEYRGKVGDLLNWTLAINPETEGTTKVNLAEEFFAELGQIRYYQYLLSLGLEKLEIATNFKNSTNFPFFLQGLVNIQDTIGIRGRLPWQVWWQPSLKFDRVDSLHYQNNRFSLFEGIGKRILFWNKNPDSRPLSRANIAGLGVVGFTDFAVYNLTNHEVLFSLVSEPLRPGIIQAKASLLFSKIPEKLEFIDK